MRKRRRYNNRYLSWLLAIVFGGLLGFLIWRVDPEVVRDVLFPGSYLPFFILLLGAVFFLLQGLWGNLRKALLYSLGGVIFLELRLIKIGNLINGLLLFSLIVAVDYYFTNR